MADGHRTDGHRTDGHRTNVLVTSCLKTPVDPRTKVPLASYERDQVPPHAAAGHVDHRDYEEMECEDSGSGLSDDDGVREDRLDLGGIFFSNEEYYSKLEELKRAHRRTMAELESMYRRKLQLGSMEPLAAAALEVRHRTPWWSGSPVAPHRLRRSHSAAELRRGSGSSGRSDEDGCAAKGEKGPPPSPKEHIRNMWRDFQLSPRGRRPSASSLPGDPRRRQARGVKAEEPWRRRVTVPKPFQMTLREAERRKCGVKTRSEVEPENSELRRRLEELTECRRKFRASPAPAHVRLPHYEERREQSEERRRRTRQQGDLLNTVPQPFSFLERERLKAEQKHQRRAVAPDQDHLTPFKARPVPRAVYAAVGERLREEQLYRSIRAQVRAQEMLHGSAPPPSMLTQRLRERRKPGGGGEAGDGFSHQPQINREVPDFDASYQRFQRRLEKHKEVKPATACEPFDLRTAQIPSHRERILANIERGRRSPGPPRWPLVGRGTSGMQTSSLCSSLSSSSEFLPAKDTDATKKRHQAVRKVLEQRRREEEEEERRRERQRHREKTLQRVVLKRAQANDPHQALAQTHLARLREFRRRDLQRRKEYQQEVQEMQRRVRGRPLLLEQVAQRNAKQAAERRYANALQQCDLTPEFISGKAARSRSAPKTSLSSDGTHSNHEELDVGYEPLRYRKVFLDGEDVEVDPDERDAGSDEASLNHHHRDDGGEDGRYSDESYHDSDDHQYNSDDSDHASETGQQEAGSDVTQRQDS